MSLRQGQGPLPESLSFSAVTSDGYRHRPKLYPRGHPAEFEVERAWKGYRVTFTIKESTMDGVIRRHAEMTIPSLSTLNDWGLY